MTNRYLPLTVAFAMLCNACTMGGDTLPTPPRPEAFADSRPLRSLAMESPSTSVPNDQAPPPGVGFALDQTRPFISIGFDHLGPRAPVYEEEHPFGAWFTLHNNCPYTIRLSSHRAGPDRFGQEATRLGELLSYEVVAVPPIFGVPITRDAQRKRPRVGHRYGNGDTPHFVDVPPRDDLMFSVPIDVLVPDVYLRIEVKPQMRPTSGNQPHIYLEFGPQDLPQDIRGDIDRLLTVGAPR